MAAPVFKATFSDFRNVKTRKTVQFIFEVPSEGADEALAILGGVPRPDKEIWVAVARLDPTKAASAPDKAAGEPQKERRRFDTLPLPQQAALRCNSEAFQRFLGEHYGIDSMSETGAADAVRSICSITSRSELKPGTVGGLTWVKLNSQFDFWLRDTQ